MFILGNFIFKTLHRKKKNTKFRQNDNKLISRKIRNPFVYLCLEDI